MRIGINALYLIPGRVGGTEIYLRSLLPALVRASPEHDFFLFLNRETARLHDLEVGRVTQIVCGVSASFRPARIIYEQTVLPIVASRHKLDIMLNAGFTAPLLSSVPMVTAIHDLQHKIHPEFFRRLDLPFWNLLVWGAVKSSKGLLVFSSRTADDIRRIYGVPRNSIAVAPHGVDSYFFALAGQNRRASRTFLTVSTLHPHKNLERLLHAFSGFLANHPGYSLVLAGARGFAGDKLEQLRDHLGLGNNVVFKGWIDRSELYKLYDSARAFIYPSLFEGFGMPVLEALATGMPVACSAIEPLLGISGGAALTFDPRNTQEIILTLEKLLTFDGSAGPAQAQRFSWDKAALATLSAIESAVS